MASFAYIYGRAGKRVGFRFVFSGKKSTAGAVPAAAEKGNQARMTDTEAAQKTPADVHGPGGNQEQSLYCKPYRSAAVLSLFILFFPLSLSPAWSDRTHSHMLTCTAFRFMGFLLDKS